MKTQIYNLIILDESGSMCGVINQTIGGCNETINTIKAAQKGHADTQEHFVSIFAFQSGGDRPSRYLLKNAPADQVKHITREDYEPDGMTNLYDAIGATLVDLKSLTREKECAIGSVTIITDGMENSSKHYTHHQVSNMINGLKEIGWNFNFIGANIDVKQTSQSLNIDNYLEFQQDEEGTQMMFRTERKSREAYYDRMACCMSDCDESEPQESRFQKFATAAKNYFTPDKEDKK